MALRFCGMQAQWPAIVRAARPVEAAGKRSAGSVEHGGCVKLDIPCKRWLLDYQIQKRMFLSAVENIDVLEMWRGLTRPERHDLIYLGIDFWHPEGSWGCHAMWVSPYARTCLLYDFGDHAIDHLWNLTEKKYCLRVWRPKPMNRYVRQKPGLRSLITFHVR